MMFVSSPETNTVGWHRNESCICMCIELFKFSLKLSIRRTFGVKLKVNIFSLAYLHAQIHTVPPCGTAASNASPGAETKTLEPH